MIRCTMCMQWFQEQCVGITKDEPVGLWLCPTCRNIPSSLINDINSLKQDVDNLKTCTKSILTAIHGLSSKLENSISGLNDRLTSIIRQINGKDLSITESTESLSATTNDLKTSFDQKSCQILNKTTAVFDSQ